MNAEQTKQRDELADKYESYIHRCIAMADREMLAHVIASLIRHSYVNGLNDAEVLYATNPPEQSQD